jgi:hypothetical protein
LFTCNQFCGSLSAFKSRAVVTSAAVANSDVEPNMVDASNATRKSERPFIVSSSFLSTAFAAI